MGKFDIWTLKYREMKEHNAKYERGETTWTKTMDQFADMTEEEFTARYLSAGLVKPERKMTVESESVERPHMVRASHVPESVDWYEAGKVSASVD